MSESYPSTPEGRLKDYWEKPVRDLVVLPNFIFLEGAAERHAMYSLLTMALVAGYWNGNKRGPYGEYPWRPKQRDKSGRYIGGDYLGHNIACIGVDAKGHVIDFDFNHNDLLNSSVEHAESRLIRRVFSLTQLYDDWATRGSHPSLQAIPYSTVLSEVTVYTSLESCSQCSGIMALGSVKEVVFLQRDPGQNSIGNILRNLSPVGGRYLPPLPIPADLFGFRYFSALVKAFDDFAAAVNQKPFYIAPDGTKDNAPSITSFLCTDEAQALFDAARSDLDKYKPQFPTFKPRAADGTEVPDALTNDQALQHMRRFLDYALVEGHRGTPHKL